ncbi:duodenase-1-like [Cyprinodon tularosa]|uniref:duodenase-1-like n=1 Tax=Cyprinodon tularosa TaxID=77115 RepID=UPI0018E25D3F|nr:duodenase-1-like [Cyprinodon tularosa]
MLGFSEVNLLLLIFLPKTVYGSHIINGEKAPANSMQYMVSVQSAGKHMCGGFLISEDFVVTAAHCSNSKPDVVVVGSHDLQNSNVEKIKIEKQCKHPDYLDVNYGDDIMLLKLSRKVSVNNRVKTIRIARPGFFLHDNQMCSVAGWGKTETSDISNDLRVVNVSIINKDVCNKEWQYGLPPNVICAGGYNTEKGFCQGDSGGPLVCNGIAVGIVSFNQNFNCAYPNVPNVYINISKYYGWLNDALKNNSRCGPNFWNESFFKLKSVWVKGLCFLFRSPWLLLGFN